MIPEVLAGIPWFWPAVAAAVGIAAVISRGVASSLGITTPHAFLLLVSVGGIVALTLTPAGNPGAVSACHLVLPPPISLAELVPLTERGLNVVLFIPLGLTLGLVPRSRVKAEAVLLAAISPAMVELTQYVVKSLGRACEGADVVDNLTGLGAGFLVAGMGMVLPRIRPDVE